MPPKELPGYYYDEEKNRYFPMKGPIPGSSRKRKSSSSEHSAQESASQPNQASKTHNSMNKRSEKLLQFRELSGNIFASSKGKLNFQVEYQKKLASQPLVWKYHETEKFADCGLELINVPVNTYTGLIATDMLVTGATNRGLCLFEVGKGAQEFDDAVKHTADCVWPTNVGQLGECIKSPPSLWSPPVASVLMPSDVSCIKTSYHKRADEPSPMHVVVTTLGSGVVGGAVFIWDLSQPVTLSFDFSSRISPITLHKIFSSKNTIWTADCNYDGSQVVIGSSREVSLVNVEAGLSSWIFRCKSDVLSTLLADGGCMILCGLRNGEIVTVDTRQNPQNYSSRYAPRIERSMYSSCKTNMPSSVSCLAPLTVDDQYFLASSMDGSIKLYDHRLIQRGAVQSYEGNVNSHTRIYLGVDPSERFVMSGGEDCKLRLWSIKSGEMVFDGQFTNSVPSLVCWPRSEGIPEMLDTFREGSEYGLNHFRGAWVGSQEGLFHLNWR